MVGKCPKCENLVTHVTMEHVEARVLGGTTRHGVSYLCPSCRTVLSVSIDPIAIQADILAAIEAHKKPSWP
jgi:hypothetical protein